MTVREHITDKLVNLSKAGLTTFKTSDIHALSSRSRRAFGKILGSPTTYERTFRQMRTDGVIEVSKREKRKGEKQQTWLLKEIKYD